MTLARRLALPLMLGGSVIGLVCAVRVLFNPFTTDVPLCPVFALTGLLCPGCGATRCIWALGGGDLALAVRSWPIVVLLAPAGLWLWATWSAARVSGNDYRPRGLLVITWTLLIAILVFGIIRNIPGAEVLQPPTTL